MRQPLDKCFEVESNRFDDDISLILEYQKSKNIIYLNKPKDIEHFSINFAENLNIISSSKIEKACGELSLYLHNEYALIDCLKKGIIYHHGSVPDNIRLYIEHLFSNEKSINFVITSSTLLEGVNIPAERLFILDNKKGHKKLSQSQFRNLIGRICRFKEIFSKEDGNLNNLVPCIYLVVSDYYSKNANIEAFISNCMRVDKKIKEKPENILLKNVNINHKNQENLNAAEEFIENFENGVISGYNKKIATTEVGKLCFANNISEIDIFTNEVEMQNVVELKRQEKLSNINDTSIIFSIIKDVFLVFTKNDNKNENIQRLLKPESQTFYKMFLDWRIKNASYSEMIASFLRYWQKIENEGKESLVYVGRKWGEVKRDGILNLWIDLKKKTSKQRVNLAIVRIKEEQDFLENNFIKFIETINDLDFLEPDFYLKIKYCTSDKIKIFLINNGISLSLSNLLVDKYRNFLDINVDSNSLIINHDLINKMVGNNESEILLFEVKSNLKKE